MSYKAAIAAVLLAAVSIGLLYGAGLMWGQHTNISVMEYWRWWVVHLWVEGVFEVFATAIIAILFVAMFGFGPFAGFLTLSFATIGFLAKLLAEDIEDIEASQTKKISWQKFGERKRRMS